MLLLFMPLMALAIVAPRAIPGGEDWSVVSAAIVGVVFGSVVSEPMARFLRSVEGHPSRPRSARGNGVEKRQDTEESDRE